MILNNNIKDKVNSLKEKYRAFDINVNEMKEFNDLDMYIQEIKGYSSDDEFYCKSMLVINVVLEKLKKKLIFLNDILRNYNKLIEDYQNAGIDTETAHAFNSLKYGVDILKQQITKSDLDEQKTDVIVTINNCLKDLEEKLLILINYQNQAANIKQNFETIEIDVEQMPVYEDLLKYIDFYKTLITNENVDINGFYLQELVTLMKEKVEVLESRFNIYNTYHYNLFKLSEKCQSSGVDTYGLSEFRVLIQYMNALRDFITQTNERDQIRDIIDIFPKEKFPIKK